MSPRLVVTETTTMENVIDRSSAVERLRAVLGWFFSGSAMLLAAAGLYSVVRARVAARQPEMAVRMALGAKVAYLRYLVGRDVVAGSLIGLLAGVPATFIVFASVRSLVPEVEAISFSTVVWSLAVVLAAMGAATMVGSSRLTESELGRQLRV